MQENKTVYVCQRCGRVWFIKDHAEFCEKMCKEGTPIKSDSVTMDFCLVCGGSLTHHSGEVGSVESICHRCDNGVKSIVEKAHDFSKKAHEGQTYGDGGDYFIKHILPVVSLVKMVTNNQNMITVAYLHDALEDTEITYGDLQDNFEQPIPDLVLELTKEGYNKFPLLKTKECIIIKFADRLCNLSNMGVWDEERQQKYLNKSKFWSSEI